MQRRGGWITWLVIVVVLATLFLIWQYFDYRSAIQTLPEGTIMAELSVGGMTHEQALNALEVAFATPLEVAYQDKQLSLSPENVGLQYDAEATAANLKAALSPRRGLNGFVAHILGRHFTPGNVPVAVGYSEEELEAFLTRVANQYDRPPQNPLPIPDKLAFRAGKAGSKLDIAASRTLLASALVSADKRHVELVVQPEAVPRMNIEMLRTMLQTLLDEHPELVPGIFIKDLQTGEELGINAKVAYSGMGVLKIAILEETYRTIQPEQIQAAETEINRLISETVQSTESDKHTAANILLRDVIDEGDEFQGAMKLTEAMHRLGLQNTFMVAPYGEQGSIKVSTPANSRADVTTTPDPYIQTTPLDISLLLEMIYQCSQGGGTLLALYPDTLTASECNAMIQWMTQNRINSLIEVGVPVDTVVAHRHGWGTDTQADAAIIFSPGSDFILTVFLHHPQWLVWEEGALLITDITKATYNYFNPTQ